MANMTDCPLVMIEWEDSLQPTAAWAYLSDFEPKASMRIASVGWLIHDGAEIKVLAPNIGGLDDADSAQMTGAIHIPTRCVVSVQKIKEPNRVTSSSVPDLSFRPVPARTRKRTSAATA
ncbi:hypothetical protein [Hyphomonas sp.]|uniref:hypothetical protein n=1 Tax=Hyphomonas sp. TaxID=87 RepID=UPI0030011E52